MVLLTQGATLGWNWVFRSRSPISLIKFPRAVGKSSGQSWGELLVIENQDQTSQSNFGQERKRLFCFRRKEKTLGADLIVASPKPQGCKKSILQELWKKDPSYSWLESPKVGAVLWRFVEKVQVQLQLEWPKKLEQSCEDLWKKFKSSHNLSDPWQNHRTRGEVKSDLRRPPF